MHLNVSGSLVGLVGNFFLHAGELLFKVGHLILVELRQVVQLFFKPLVPEHTVQTHTRR